MVTPIQLTEVTKYYSHAKVAAVNNLSLAIQYGEVYGLLGANGAGKTTTLRMILDFIRPTSGTIQLLGENVRQGGAKLRNQVSYLPGDVILPKKVSGRAFLNYLGDINHAVDGTYMLQLTKRFEAQLDKQMDELSKGNRQKIGIIQAFMMRPAILILDEPTSGLDPLMQEKFYQTVNEARERGTAVLLSSHSFEEVDRTCDRIGILRKGELVYEGIAADIIATQKPRWRIALRKPSDVAKLKHAPAIRIIETGRASVIVEPADTIEKALATLSHFGIVSMTTSQHSLEDEFLHFYEEDSEK